MLNVSLIDKLDTHDTWRRRILEGSEGQVQRLPPVCPLAWPLCSVFYTSSTSAMLLCDIRAARPVAVAQQAHQQTGSSHQETMTSMSLAAVPIADSPPHQGLHPRLSCDCSQCYCRPIACRQDSRLARTPCTRHETHSSMVCGVQQQTEMAWH